MAALLFGAGCWTEGCSRLAFYRGESDQREMLNGSIRSEADRARADALYHRFVEVSDAARGRAVPMAAATFVLGMALLALAARGMGGRTNPRSALIQIVAAQAIVVAASYFVTRDVRDAERDWETERVLIHQRENLGEAEYAQVEPMFRSWQRVGEPAWLALRTFASLLIIVALTRPRTRAFFEAAARPISER